MKNESIQYLEIIKENNSKIQSLLSICSYKSKCLGSTNKINNNTAAGQL